MLTSHGLCMLPQLRRGTRPPNDAAAWQAVLEDALPSAPKVKLSQRAEPVKRAGTLQLGFE